MAKWLPIGQGSLAAASLLCGRSYSHGKNMSMSIARTKRGTCCCLKCYHLGPDKLGEQGRKRLQQVLAIRDSLQHPNLVPILGHWEFEDELTIAEEFFLKGDLLAVSGRPLQTGSCKNLVLLLLLLLLTGSCC